MPSLGVTIYALPLGLTIFFLAVLLVFWQVLTEWQLTAARREWRVCRLLLVLLLLGWTAVVLHSTVFSRGSGPHEIQLIPFYLFKMILADGNREAFRSAWMNSLLFVPGGLLLDTLLPTGWKRRNRCLLVLLTFGVMSTGIETVQAVFALGRAETDDVIFNTLGAGIGLLIREQSLRSAEHSF